MWPGSRSVGRHCPLPWRSSCPGLWPALLPPRPGPAASGYRPVWKSTDVPRRMRPDQSYWDAQRRAAKHTGENLKQFNRYSTWVSVKLCLCPTCGCIGSPVSWSGCDKLVSGQGLGHMVRIWSHMISPSPEWCPASAAPPPPSHVVR